MDQIVRQRRPSLSIELSPLIDCVFLLLIFFMLSSTMLAPAIELDLPSASLAGDVQSPEIVVTVDSSGRMLLNAEEIPVEELSARLSAMVSGSRRKVVTYRGDSGSDHATFVRVLEAAEAAGVDHVDVVYEPVGQ
ncbi:MAG: biopolymer transporter ExbD [Planctomycetaceae bacterium]